MNLPPIPDPHRFRCDCEQYEPIEAYSEEQMDEYGQACYAAGRISIFEELPVCEIERADNINGFIFKEIDGRMKFLRIGDKLYVK